MSQSICGVKCAQCPSNAVCGGCRETGGRPFGKACTLAACCRAGGRENCGQDGSPCGHMAPLIAEFNALGIPDMAEVTRLDALVGACINLAYTLPNGQTVKLLEDEKIYLGGQTGKQGSDRYYGLAADEDFLLVCEYGEGGSDPKIVVYQRREIRICEPPCEDDMESEERRHAD